MSTGQSYGQSNQEKSSWRRELNPRPSDYKSNPGSFRLRPYHDFQRLTGHGSSIDCADSVLAGQSAGQSRLTGGKDRQYASIGADGDALLSIDHGESTPAEDYGWTPNRPMGATASPAFRLIRKTEKATAYPGQNGDAGNQYWERQQAAIPEVPR